MTVNKKITDIEGDRMVNPSISLRNNPRRSDSNNG